MSEDSPDSPEEVSKRLDKIGLRVLEVFYTVVEEGGFTRAAEELNVSQPTVSQHIKQMETILGDKLFLRNTSDQELTKLGELCYEQIKAIQKARNDLRSALEEYYDVRQRNALIGASTIPGEFLLPGMLADFSDRYPKYCVELRIKDSEKINQQVNHGELRLGIVGSKPSGQQVDSTLLVEDQMVLVGSPNSFDHKITPDQLDQFAYVGRETGSGTQQAVSKRLAEEGYNPDELLNFVARLETIQAVKKSVMEGLGVSFLPWSVVREDLERDRLMVLGDQFPVIPREFRLIENKFLGLSPPLNKFKKFLVDYWAEDQSDYG